MSYFIPPFEVDTPLMPEPVRVRFVHLHSAIATRHSDTIDCIFRVGGRQVTVAISCAALAEVGKHQNQHFSDQQLAEMAACFLRRTLEQGYDVADAGLLLGEPQLRQVARELGYL
jgi:hypothetical protein